MVTHYLDLASGSYDTGKNKSINSGLPSFIFAG